MPVRPRPRSEDADPNLAPAFLEAVHANPWADDLVDYAPLNAPTSQAIELAIERVREVARAAPSGLRSTCLTVLGPAGAGKTHLFARLRKRLGPRAVFVHVRPLLGSDMTPRLILQEIVRQLGYVTAGLRQIDALVGSAVSYCAGGTATFPSFFLMDYARLARPVRAARLEHVLECLLAVWQQADEAYLRQLLSTPFADAATQRAQLAWLSGRELDPTQLARTGLREPLDDGLILPALKTLAGAASVGAPIVLVFDQLENLIEHEAPSARLLAYAQLTTDLVDTVPGLVIVQMALDTEWDRGIEPTFNLAQRSRLAAQRHLLALPTPADRESLIRLWADQLPGPTAPFSWPFGPPAVERLCAEPGVTPRMLLVAFRRALDLAATMRTDADRDAADRVALPSEPPSAAAPSAPLPGELAAVRPAEPAPAPDGTAAGQAATEAPRPGDSAAPRAGAPQEPQVREGGRTPSSAPRVSSRVRIVDAFAQAWEAHLAAARSTVAEAYQQGRSTDPARLADGFVAAMRFCPGLKLVNVRQSRPAQILVSRTTATVHIALLYQAHFKSVGATLARLADLAAVHEVLVIRERAVELPASWADTRMRQRTLLSRPNAHWLSLEVEDAARLLALESLVSAARSHDVTDNVGRTLKEQDVLGWIDRMLGVAAWTPIRAIYGDHEERPEPPSSKPSSSPLPQSMPPAPEPPPASSRPLGPVLSVLARLRVASVERVVREVLRSDSTATRDSVIAELQANGDRVHWVGEGLVCLRE